MHLCFPVNSLSRVFLQTRTNLEDQTVGCFFPKKLAKTIDSAVFQCFSLEAPLKTVDLRDARGSFAEVKHVSISLCIVQLVQSDLTEKSSAHKKAIVPPH